VCVCVCVCVCVLSLHCPFGITKKYLAEIIHKSFDS